MRNGLYWGVDRWCRSGYNEGMQTFLPYESFEESFKCLDYRRLGKQRVEARQIYDCLTGAGSLRWGHHPAVKMWRGCEKMLALYHDQCIAEWIFRGYKNNMPYLLNLNDLITHINKPNWLGDERVHASHRANLLRKKPEHYSQFGWSELPQEGYFWPK